VAKPDLRRSAWAYLPFGQGPANDYATRPKEERDGKQRASTRSFLEFLAAM